MTCKRIIFWASASCRCTAHAPHIIVPHKASSNAISHFFHRFMVQKPSLSQEFSYNMDGFFAYYTC